MTEAHEKRQVTMRDVAALAGVNASTVSRVLRNAPLVSEETRERVMRAVEKLQYRPNPYVQAFTAHVRGYRRLPEHAPVAVLNCYPSSEPHPFLNPYLAGLRERAGQTGFKLEIQNLEQLHGSLNRFRDILYTRNIRGLVVLPVPSGTELPELERFQVAMATIDYSLKFPYLHRVAPSYFQNMEMVMRNLHLLGYRRVGFCSSRREVDRLGMHLLGAYTAWCALQEPPPNIPVHLNPHLVQYGGTFVDTPGQIEKARMCFRAWLREHKPDVVVSNNVSYLNWMREDGVDVPGEIGFVHLGRSDEHPTITRVNQNLEAIGAAAMDLVLSQLHQNEAGVPRLMRTVLIYGDWQPGDTTRPQ